MLGNVGSNMFIDRYIECLNYLQQKRMNSFTGFEKGLHHTHLLKAMLHGAHASYLFSSCTSLSLAFTVDHAFRDAQRSPSRTNDVFSKSMAFESRKLQDMFKRRLGVDVTKYDPSIPFWHTGNPVSMFGTNWRQLRPWEWIWKVAAGLFPGKERSEHLTWSAFVARFIRQNMFAF